MSLKRDRELALFALEKDASVISYFIDDFKSEREIAKKAILQNGAFLEYVDEDLQSGQRFCNGCCENDADMRFQYAD